MAISDNIKRLRVAFNLTQAEFGKIAGVSDKAVSTWEKGTAEPRMGAVQRIADHFGIPKSAIVDDSEPSPEENRLATMQRLYDKHHVLFKALDTATPEEISQVEKYLEFLKSQR